MDGLSHNGSASATPQMFPLSPNQLEVWRAYVRSPQNPTLSISEYLEIEGLLNAKTFIHAVSRAVTETDALHLRFCETPNGLCCYVAPKVRWVLAYLDETAKPDPYTAAREWIQEDACQPVDITEGPLFSIGLFRCAHDRHLFYARYHRIIATVFDRSALTKRIADIYFDSLETPLENEQRSLLHSMYRAHEKCMEVNPLAYARAG